MLLLRLYYLRYCNTALHCFMKGPLTLDCNNHKKRVVFIFVLSLFSLSVYPTLEWCVLGAVCVACFRVPSYFILMRVIFFFSCYKEEDQTESCPSCLWGFASLIVLQTGHGSLRGWCDSDTSDHESLRGGSVLVGILTSSG